MSTLRANIYCTPAHQCTAHTNSTLIQLVVFLGWQTDSMCVTKRVSTVCHSPCCKGIFSSETCCSCVAVDNGSLPCFSNQRSLFNPPTHCLPISLSAFLSPPNSHHSNLCPYDECLRGFGSAPAETQTEPQRGHRRDTSGGPAGCLSSDEPASM